MYLMFGDEADRQAVQGKKFFVYGAIFAPTNSLVALHNAIEQLRIKNNMANTDSLKSASGSRSKSMSFEAHRDLKAEVENSPRSRQCKVLRPGNTPRSRAQPEAR
jgi:hypothetical protein